MWAMHEFSMWPELDVVQHFGPKFHPTTVEDADRFDPDEHDELLVGSCSCETVSRSNTGWGTLASLAMEWDGTQWSTSPTQNDGVFVSPDSGSPGAAILVSGGGFQSGEQVTVTYKRMNKHKRSVPLCDTFASSEGFFSCSGVVPKNPGSPNYDLIVATGNTSGIEAESYFYPT